jgi:type II secretory pathway component GspD/PulD (secretin)
MHGLTLQEKTPGSGIWSIVPKSPDAVEPLHVKVIRLKFAAVTDVAPIVEKMMGEGGGSVSQFAARNTIVIRATADTIEQITHFIEEIDMARDQVYIESKFVELDHGEAENIGIDWTMLRAYSIGAKLGYSYGDERKTVQTENNALKTLDRHDTLDSLEKKFDINNQQFESRDSEFVESPPDSGNFVEKVTITPTRTLKETFDTQKSLTRDVGEDVTRTITDVRTAVLSPADLRVVLSALEEMSGVAIISNPKIIVANEEKAEIHIGESEPNIKGSVTPGQQGQANTTTYELDPTKPYFTFGIQVEVTPTVNTASNITVQIVPRLTRFVRDKVAPDGNTFPVTSEKSIRTLFNLSNGKTAAIGGLTESTERESRVGIPLLGDIPLIGKYLFSHKTKEKSQAETIIFVTVGMANPEGMDPNVGMPEYTQDTQKQMIKRSLQQKQVNAELEKMKAAAENPEALEKTKSRLGRKSD